LPSPSRYLCHAQSNPGLFCRSSRRIPRRPFCQLYAVKRKHPYSEMQHILSNAESGQLVQEVNHARFLNPFTDFLMKMNCVTSNAKMKLFASIGIIYFSLFPPAGSAQVNVPGYYRGDGGYVKPHQRSAPDGIKSNNYGYPGNYNPNTGRTTPGKAKSSCGVFCP
jgi:hypothetical protein